MSHRRGRPRPTRHPARPRPGPSREPVRVRVGQPSDLLAIVPYLLGFHPRESLVALLIRDGRIALAARCDLGETDDTEAFADYLAGLGGRYDADRVALVGYSADREQACELLAQLASHLGPERVGEVVYTDGERWWSPRCARPCCPSEGTPYRLDSHPVSAQAVFAGLSAQPDRGALVATVQGPPATELTRLTTLLDAVLDDAWALAGDRRRAAATIQSRVRAALDADRLGDRECLELAVLSLDLVVRDHAWALMTRDDAEDHVRVWGQVVAVAPPAVAAGPLALLGAAGWISGNGALLNCCVDRLAAEAPGYTLGHILSDLSEQCTAPSLWEDWLPVFRDDLDALGRESPLGG